jgi:cytochrome c oxidase cbb3-type subunit 2
MKGMVGLFLGILGTFAFSWFGLILIPNFQIGHLEPQTDEEGNDPYPAPKSGMTERGRRIYAANGCVYCHSLQLRSDFASSDVDRTRDLNSKPKWGERRSAPRDDLFERPVMLGKMRLGPDLANMGKAAPVEDAAAAAPGGSPGAAAPVSGSPAPASPAGTSPSGSPEKPGTPGSSPAAAPSGSPSMPTPAANASPSGSPAKPVTPSSSPAGSPAPGTSSSPSAVTNVPGQAGVASVPNADSHPYTAAWHHRHLYSPRSLVRDSNMPAYRFLYEKRRITGERSSDALQLGEEDPLPGGWEVVPSYNAKCLVAFLMSLDQSHSLQEVKTSGSTSASAPAPASPAPVAKEAK